eukprot:scaffold66326_cov57-Attheya_sp.AAC.2
MIGVPEDIGRHILSFLDVPTLVQKKSVCRSWKLLFTNTINQKASAPKAFESRTELKEAVNTYTKYNLDDAEAFVSMYGGWPIDRWDVSNIRDFSGIFAWRESFNEYIGPWDMSTVPKI